MNSTCFVLRIVFIYTFIKRNKPIDRSNESIVSNCTCSAPPPRLLSPFRGGELRTSLTRIAMLTGVFILLVGSPKSDRLK